MQEAAQYFIGQHDFTSFRNEGCQSASPVKTIYSVNILEFPLPWYPESYYHEKNIEIVIKGNSFLYKQVGTHSIMQH